MREINFCKICGKPINDDHGICEFCQIDIEIKVVEKEIEM